MAERGARDAAPRADEADGPDQRAQSDGQGLCRRPAAPGQCARHALQHGRLPDQAEAWRAGAHLPHDPGPGERRVRAARRPAPQHLHQLAALARRVAAAEGRAAACASPARSPAARAMSKAPRSACSPAASPPPSGSGQAPSLPPPTTAFGALLNHITGGHIVSDDEPGKRSFQPMNVNFGLFPPIEAPKTEGKRAARQGQDRRQAARHHLACAGRLPRMARPARAGASGGIASSSRSARPHVRHRWLRQVEHRGRGRKHRIGDMGMAFRGRMERTTQANFDQIEQRPL